MEERQQRSLSIAVVGAGLVGSLAACYFGKRGHHVQLFEYRKDIRGDSSARGRSINLALSTRGRRALAGVGLEQVILRHGLPMEGRMLHTAEGPTRSVPYDPRNHQCIYSVNRMHLNETLLNEAEKKFGVTTHFEHKLTNIDFNEGKLYFRRPNNMEPVEWTADLIIGADGAFSSVRRVMSRQPMFDFSQKYIDHCYIELCIPATPDDKFAMEKQYLHIWPRGSFMMIALPNQDKSWTVTLFMEKNQFDKLDTPEKLLDFFLEYFPDSIPLIGKERLIDDFFRVKPSCLVSIKCRPYHAGSKAVIIGDAAHAMVPFYGQGMNAGFEDCFLLDELLHKHNSLEEALQLFSLSRPDNAHAICDLAMYNYIEMRDLVTKRSWLLRRKLDTILHQLAPSFWLPLYETVTFSHTPYATCLETKQYQDKVVRRSILAVGGGILFFVVSYGKIIGQLLKRILLP